MRPRIVEALAGAFGTTLLDWLVPSPALVYAIAMLAAVVLLRHRSRAAPGLSAYHALGLALWTMVGALVGARAFFLLQHLRETLANPSSILDPTGATGSWGAYAGGAAGLLLYCGRHRLDGARYADLLATTVGLVIAIGRWACFLNGDDFGTPSDLPWAVRFPHGSYPFAHQVNAGLISPLDALSMPVHPAQLYLSAAGLALFALTGWFWRKHRERPGATVLFFWLAHGVSRFVLEFFRADHDHFLLGLPSSQSLSLMTAAAAAVGLWWVFRGPVLPEASTLRRASG